MNPNQQLRFLSEQFEAIRNLPGFQKHFKVPTSESDSDRKFLYSLVQDLIDEDLQTIFSSTRKSFGLKRKELSTDGPYDGFGSVSLPFFDYKIVAEFAQGDPSRVCFRRTIENISEPARVLAPAFEEAIPFAFSSLQWSAKDPLDLEGIIDAIEDAEIDGLAIDYDKDLTWCELTLPSAAASIRITSEQIETQSARGCSPKELLESFAAVQQFIAELDLVPFAFQN